MARDAPARNPRHKEVHVEAVETYPSVFTVVSASLLLVVTGLAKRQIVWKAKPLLARRRRRRS
jgi:hypothetical protein